MKKTHIIFKRILSVLTATAFLIACIPKDFRLSINAEEETQNYSLKWKDVTFTTFSSVALAEDGSLYVWGTGEDYSTSTRFSPTEVSVDFRIVDINGNYALSDDGNVYYISFDESLPKATLVLTNVKTLCRQSAISNDGELYLFDTCFDGNGNYISYNYSDSVTKATKVNSLQNVISACNNRSSVAAVTMDGSLYTWGSNAMSMNWGNGHLGYFSNNPEYNEYDQKELYPKKVNITGVMDASFNGSFGELFVLKDDGTLCILNYLNEAISFDTIFSNIETFTCDSSNMSGDVLFAISTSSSLYAMGTSIYGWGNGQNMGWGNDIQEELTQFGKIKYATSNGNCFAVITEQGDLYTWGSNTYGQIGNGKKATGDSSGLGVPNTEDVFEAYKIEVVINSFAQAHLYFIEENPNVFVSSDDVYALNQTTNLMKDYDLSVTDYLALKQIQDFFAGDVELDKSNVEMTVQALVGELLCNQEMVAHLDASAQQAIEDANNQILKEMQNYSAYFGLTDDMIETVDQLVSTADKSTTMYKNSRAEFLSKYLSNTKIEKLSNCLGVLSKGTKFLSIGVDILNETTASSEELYQFWLACVAYEAADDSLQEAFKLLVDYVQEEAVSYVGETDDYSQRIMLIAKELLFYYEFMTNTSEDKYEQYANYLGGQVGTSTAVKIATTIVVDLVETVAASLCPQLLLIGIVFDVTMSVWEQFTMVDERALERDMHLNMIVFYDAIVGALTDENSGFKANLIANKTLDSALVYEEGVGFYKRITIMMVNYAQQYYAMLYEDIHDGKWWNSSDIDMLFLSAGLLGDAYTDKVTGITGTIKQAKRLLAGTVEDEYEKEMITNYLTLPWWKFNSVKTDVLAEIVNIQFSLELFVDDVKEISCHELIMSSEPVTRPDFYVYDVACPVNLTIKNGETVVAEVVNDILTTLDEKVPVSVNLIKEEGDIYASKFIVVPADYDVEITGYADGTMYFEKVVVENGYLSTISTISDVPVQNGSAYTEVIENNSIVALTCDLNGDGMTDETLFAEVTKFEGDIDSDGKVTSADALITLQMVVGLTENNDVADLDGDGAVTSNDALIVLQTVVGLR